jgi:uroporphyrinogen decarboxylase
MSTLIKKSLKKENPIWLMRQAGRYLPEYQKVRKRQKDFIKFCLNIKDATKVTLQPIKRYDFDAAIIFSDILIIPYGIGQEVKFEESIGPILGEPDLKLYQQTKKGKFIKKIKNVYKIIKNTRKKLNKNKSLIGFVGSPWTILVYVLNQRSPKEISVCKKIIKNKQSKQLLKIIEKFIYIHIEQQIKAGVDTIQLFDSWAGLLNKKDLNYFCFQPTKRIIIKVRKKYPLIPIICFPKGIKTSIKEFCKIVKPNVLSIDSEINPNFILKEINPNIIIQGGMSPGFLFKRKSQMQNKIKFYLNKFKNRAYIFNLGHGVPKETKTSTIQNLVNTVRNFK